jgi:hypothetical protein
MRLANRVHANATRLLRTARQRSLTPEFSRDSHLNNAKPLDSLNI